jgi:hypothetical protein
MNPPSGTYGWFGIRIDGGTELSDRNHVGQRAGRRLTAPPAVERRHARFEQQRLVTGDDQFAWAIFSRSSHTLADSGDEEPNPPRLPARSNRRRAAGTARRPRYTTTRALLLVVEVHAQLVARRELPGQRMAPVFFELASRTDFVRSLL